MNLYCIICFQKNKNINTKREIDEKKSIFMFVVLTAVLKSLKLLMEKN